MSTPDVVNTNPPSSEAQYHAIMEDLNQYFGGKIKLEDTLKIGERDLEANDASQGFAYLLKYMMSGGGDTQSFDLYREKIDGVMHSYMNRIEEKVGSNIDDVSLFKSDFMLTPPTIQAKLSTYLIPKKPYMVSLTLITFHMLDGKCLSVCPMITTVSQDPDLIEHLSMMNQKYLNELAECQNLSDALDIFLNKIAVFKPS